MLSWIIVVWFFFNDCAKEILPLFYNIHKVMTTVMICIYLTCTINTVVTFLPPRQYKQSTKAWFIAFAYVCDVNTPKSARG